MKTLFFKFTKPLYWEKGVGLDLVAYTDRDCTNDLFRWPEFCSDKFPPKTKTEMNWRGEDYKIEWVPS